ncbi:MAG: TM2 domain-containing protein [Clostridiales bacterium]|nr:TM2 domain-containing protein [Clostridiales bacterium]
MNENTQPQIIINNENNNSNVNTNTVGAVGVGNPKNKWVAFFLALFLGGIGAHKFYEGKILLGIIYLVFCWTGIPSFIGFIEAIIILFKPNPYYV